MNKHQDSELAARAGTDNESELMQAVTQAILDGDATETMRLMEEALSRDIDVKCLVQRALVDGMEVVGRDFKTGEFYVPDVLMSSRALQAALFTLKKHGIVDVDERSSKGTIVVGTAAGDLHDIGKNITALMLQIEGFTVIDLGIDVVPQGFVNAVRTYHPQILGLSALLTTTVGEMKRTIEALEEEHLRDEVRVYVSGAPLTKELADAMGADHYCPDVRDSVAYANEVMAKLASA